MRSIIARHPGKTTAVVIALLVAVAVVRQVWWAITVQPGESLEHFDNIQGLVEGVQEDPKAENSWPDLMRALDAHARAEAAFVYSGTELKPRPADWPESLTWAVSLGEYLDADATPQERAAFDRFMGRIEAEGIESHLTAVASGEKFIRPIDRSSGRLICVLLPELRHARGVARYCAAVMRRSADAGDADARSASLDHGLAIANALARQGTLIDRLVAQAIVAALLKELRHELIEHPPSASESAMLLRVIDARLPLVPLEHALNAERESTLDIIRWSHSDDGKGDGKFLPSAAMGIGDPGVGYGSTPVIQRLRNVSSFMYPSKAATTRKANEMYDELIRIGALPGYQRGSLAADLDLRVEHLRDEGFTVLALVMPALGATLRTNDQHLNEVLATRLMLRIEQFRAVHARPPAGLDELPGGAGEPDQYSGKPLVYRVLPTGGPPPYILYTVGLDGADNDGVEQDPGVGSAIGRNGEGFDFSYTRARPMRYREPGK